MSLEGKVSIACLDGNKIERKWRSIMVWSKWYHCWCSGDGDVHHSTMIDFGCVNSRILWIKFKFSRVKVCV